MTGPAQPTLGRDLAVFGVASLVAQVVSAATTPIYTRVLGPSEFGLYETALAVASLAMTVLMIGFDQGVVVEVARSNQPKDRGATLGSSLATPTALALVAGFVGMVISILTGGSVIAIVVVVTTPLMMLSWLSQQGLRAIDAVGPFLWSVGYRSVAATAITCILIFAVQPTAAMVLLGTGVGAGLAVISNVIATGRRYPLRLSANSTRQLLRFGVPLLPSLIAGWSSMLVDRLVLARWSSFEEVGVYSVAARVSGLLLTGMYAFQTAWTARAVAAYHQHPEREADDRRRAFLLLGALLGFGSAVLIAFGPEMIALVGGSAYASADPILPILVISSAIFSISAVAQIPALATGRTGAISTAAVVSAVVNLALNLLLVPAFGLLGAAMATLMAFSMLTTWNLLISRSIAPAGLPIGQVAWIWLALLPVGLLGLFEPTVPLLALKVASIGLAVFGLHRVKLLTYGELLDILR